MPDAFLAAFATGFALMATLIVAIGAQNTFVLRQGLARSHVGLVVGLCITIDVLLVAAGTAGVARFAALHPVLMQALAWGGAAFLAGYALAAARRALVPGGGLRSTDAATTGAGATALQTLAVTLLNPHVYLDTVVLAGAVGAQQPSPLGFVGGAGLASATWFAALGHGARWLRPLFQRAAAWRVLDAVIAATMLLLAWRLFAG